jgi:hypothetical protein
MKRLRLLSLILLLAAAAAATAAPARPPLFAASYDVRIDGMKIGEMTRAMKALGNDTYLLETEAFSVGLVSWFKPDRYVERSTLQATDDGYLPIEFYSRYTGRSKEVIERLRFDWEQMRVVSLRDGKENELPLESGVLDKLMYQAVMQRELARGVTRFRYRVADRGKIGEYEMDVIAHETVRTVVGDQRTVVIKKGTTRIWCAENLDYVPVRLEQREDGHVIVTDLVALTRETAHTEPAPTTVVEAPAQQSEAAGKPQAEAESP